LLPLVNIEGCELICSLIAMLLQPKIRPRRYLESSSEVQSR
jgi:hypothetical protein